MPRSTTAHRAVTKPRFLLFPTRFGTCGIAWHGDAITRVQLAEATPEATKAKLAAHGATPATARDRPPTFVREAMKRIRSHLAGRPQEFSSLPLALDLHPEAHRRIYEAARTIAAGETITYGKLAARAGLPRAARAAGAAMATNPFILVVPCHRVLAENGSLHGFSAHGGVFTKRRILALEGVATSIPRQPLPKRRPDGLEFDWSASLAHLRKVDPPLGPLIKRIGRRRIEIRALHDPFHSLIRSIVYQQLSGKAAATILERVLALFPQGRFPTPAEVLATDPAQLRAAGLSTSKTKSLRDLAEKAEAGVIPSLRALDRLRDEEIIERLTSVYGIGKWSIEMMLMFRLGRADVMPVEDLGVRKGFDVTYKTRTPVTPTALEAYAEKWRPYRSVASWLMWRAIELATKPAT